MYGRSECDLNSASVFHETIARNLLGSSGKGGYPGDVGVFAFRTVMRVHPGSYLKTVGTFSIYIFATVSASSAVLVLNYQYML